MQEEKGNYEAINTAVEKVSEGGDGGNNVEQLVGAATGRLEDGGTIEGEGASSIGGQQQQEQQ